ncbi:MAG: type IV pilus biogenesis protein PilP [Syntrophotalea acetylenica]|nr:type IV pilus biogenesis protein PilP [Syntrophotalea acetylenica]
MYAKAAIMVAGIVLLSVGFAAAEPKTLADWHDLDGRIVELEKRVRLAELERKLEEQKLQQLPSLPPPPGGQGQILPPQQILAIEKTEKPFVLSVSGRADQLKAVLQWKDGAQLLVKTGDVIPGGRVMAVSANKVIVNLGGEITALAFASRPEPKQERSRR